MTKEKYASNIWKIYLLYAMAGFTFFYLKDMAMWIYPLIFTTVIFTGFSLTSYLLDFPRLFVYGTLVGVSFPIGEILYTVYRIPHHGYPVVFSISGGIMIITGIVLLGKFLKQYPKQV